MPRRALVADVEVLSSQVVSGALPHVKQIKFDGTNDVVTVELLCKGLDLPVTLSIICGDIDSYPRSSTYFLSLENAPYSYDRAVTEVQSATQVCTLSEVIQQVSKAFVRLQEKTRTGRLPTAEEAIIIHGSSSEEDNPGIDIHEKTGGTAHSNGRRKKGTPVVALGRFADEKYVMDYGNDDNFVHLSRPAISSPKTTRRKSAKSDTGLRHLASPNIGAKAKCVADGDLNGMDDAFDDGFGYISDDARDDAKGAGDADDAEDNSIIYYSSMGKPHPRQERIGEDLEALRQYGYYFGVLSGMDVVSKENLLAISIRTSDLGLSPEMLLAWDLDPQMFIVLLIRLSSRYMGYEALMNSSRSDIDLSFRIGKCSSYKPFAKDALAAFGSVKDGWTNVRPAKTGASFSKILISNSLASFMNDQFLTLARYREDTNCSWADAVDAVVNRNLKTPGGGDCYNAGQEDDRASGHRQKSFPLLAMQFAMDQLTNCTVYCQACHNQVERRLRSLKPTVCSRDLCLYQYINLGMGRSAEYEILCQPNVVDLLINFCYAALRSSLTAVINPVRAYPTCLPLKVIDWHDAHKGVYNMIYGSRTSFLLSTDSHGKSLIQQYKPGQWVAIFVGELSSHPASGTLLDSAKSQAQALAGQTGPPQHTLPGVILRHAIITGVDEANSTVYVHHFDDAHPAVHNCAAEIFRYTKDFDDVPARSKAAQLLVLLDTLPPVNYLKSELEKPSVTDLKSVTGVSPAAAVLLGWIIATNRSCILQIHEPRLMVKENDQTGTLEPPKEFLQFCFLQGLPEADFEFQQQLVQAENPNHRTLLAWHGSNVSNWHSILRTGLDFSITANGRSYGHGVYFSNAFSVSLGYATSTGPGTQWPKAVLDLRSVVSLNEIINAPSKFTSCTPHYVVQHPNWSRCHFLFAKPETKRAPPPPPAPVAPRYNLSVLSTMFDSAPYRRHQLAAAVLAPAVPTTLPTVTHRQTAAQNLAAQAQGSVHRWQSAQTVQDGFFQQDLTRQAYGPTGGVVFVPCASMPAPPSTWQVSERRPKRARTALLKQKTMDASDLAFLTKGDEKQESTKKRHSGVAMRTKSSTSTPVTAVVIDLVSDSDADEPGPGPAPNLAPAAAAAVSASKITPPVRPNVTPFQPGSLNYASLPQLPLPSWCTSQAQRALGREMGRMQKVQRDTPLSDLGWYIDFSRLDNMFQWIVELHSFDLSLPLANDMMRLAVTSIVCELRFGADYPMSPPLVRVIRPRFLPFLQGGGGNVTSGGAMCMELLTSTGWSPANQTDAVLLQVRLVMSALDRPARLDPLFAKRDYGVAEAFDAYKRAAATHGWKVPKDMQARMTF